MAAQYGCLPTSQPALYNYMPEITSHFFNYYYYFFFYLVAVAQSSAHQPPPLPTRYPQTFLIDHVLAWAGVLSVVPIRLTQSSLLPFIDCVHKSPRSCDKAWKETMHGTFSAKLEIKVHIKPWMAKRTVQYYTGVRLHRYDVVVCNVSHTSNSLTINTTSFDIRR